MTTPLAIEVKEGETSGLSLVYFNSFSLLRQTRVVWAERGT